MLDINLVRENPELVKKNQLKADRKTIEVDEILKLDKKWREKKLETDKLRSKRNQISEEINNENLSLLLKNITAGGVLIYSEKIRETVDLAENYFRRLPFCDVEIKNQADKIVIKTEMGNIPLLSGDENFVKNINGIQLLCQQFGVMEEDFYEALMSFE